MSDLSTQLREYFDATTSPVEVEEVMSDDLRVPSKTLTRRRAPMVPAWAYGLGLLVLILAVAVGLSLLADGTTNEVVQPPPTTMAPDVETLTDLEVIQAGVEALYSGDAERAVELFGIEDSPVWRNHPGGDDEAQIRDDELIRREAAYLAVIGGRLTLDCTEDGNTPGMFACNVPYHNALTDAVGYVDSPGDLIQVVVQDGVITQFGYPQHLVQGSAHEFPEHNRLMRSVVSFLREEVEGSEGCWDDPTSWWAAIRTAECARLIMDHLDDWATWYQSNG